MAKKTEKETEKTKKKKTPGQIKREKNLMPPWKKGDIPNPFGLPLTYDENWANYTAGLIIEYTEKSNEPFIEDFYWKNKDKIRCVLSTFYEKLKIYSVLSEAVKLLKEKERISVRNGFRDGANNKYYEFMLNNLGYKANPETHVTVNTNTNIEAKTVENLDVFSNEELEKLEEILDK